MCLGSYIERTLPPTNNQFAGFNPFITNRATGDVRLAGRNGAPTHFTPNVFNDFLPRIGFAWSLSASTIDGGQNPLCYLQNGVPSPAFNQDANGNSNIPASLIRPSNKVTGLELRSRSPCNQTWQLGFQRKIIGNWVLEADYVATRGVKLPVLVPANQLPANLWGPVNLQSLRPFPQYLNVSHLTNDGNLFCNSPRTSARRRWGNGVLQFIYTWLKITDYVDGPAASSGIRNIYNLKAEHGIASCDVPHRFAFYGPGIENRAVSLMRNVMLRERQRLQFHAEFYNVMNHPNFRNVTSNWPCASSGKTT
jgi:hypothetical protein